MSIWLTEQDWRELRQEQSEYPGLTLNVAFLNEIKQDSQKPAEIIGELRYLIAEDHSLDPREMVTALGNLRDELETQFALEEFYGYFQSARVTHPYVSVRTERLKTQHEVMYLDLCELVELAESALYRESPLEKTWSAIADGFRSFVQSYNQHEQEEFELMMRLCNDEIGVGD